jgi:MFS family permease
MSASRPISRRRSLPGGREFHLLLASLAVSSCGDWLYNVALMAFVYDRTRSGTWVALTTAARVTPVVVLGPLGGVLADRCDRRALMITSDLIRAALMAAVAAVAIADLPIVLAPMLAALSTVAAAVQPPSVAASTARLVPGCELQRANALRAAIGQGAVVAGPALGALVLIVAAPATGILLNGLTFIASAAAIAAVPAGPAFAPPRTNSERSPGVLTDVVEGARALRGAPAALRLVGADLLCSGVYGVLTVTLLLLSRKLGAGGAGYGMLLGAFGVGGVVGAMVTGRMSDPERWRNIVMIALLLVATALAALGSVPSLAEALVAALLGGGGMVAGEVLSETALPRTVADDVLARVYGLVVPASLGGIVLGSLIAGPLVALLGLTGALTTTGGVVLLACGFLMRRPLVLATSRANA